MDGAVLDANAFARGVLGDPGSHVIEMRAPGREDRRYEVTLAEGTTFEVTVEPGPARAGALAAGGAPGAGAQGADNTASAAPSRTLEWALAGGGLAVVGAGAVTGLLAMNKWKEVQRECDLVHDSCTDDGVRASSAGSTLAAVSTAAFIVGGASVAVGGYLLLTKKDAPATARLSASAGPAALGLRLVGEF
jgi:hypothetical protein